VSCDVLPMTRLTPNASRITNAANAFYAFAPCTSVRLIVGIRTLCRAFSNGMLLAR
jgi:hypothetical protein